VTAVQRGWLPLTPLQVAIHGKHVVMRGGIWVSTPFNSCPCPTLRFLGSTGSRDVFSKYPWSGQTCMQVMASQPAVR
jgi:hypothetical protein